MILVNIYVEVVCFLSIRPPTTPKPKKDYVTNPNLETHRQKWTTFTCICKEITYITNIYIY